MVNDDNRENIKKRLARILVKNSSQFDTYYRIDENHPWTNIMPDVMRCDVKHDSYFLLASMKFYTFSEAMVYAMEYIEFLGYMKDITDNDDFIVCNVDDIPPEEVVPKINQKDYSQRANDWICYNSKDITKENIDVVAAWIAETTKESFGDVKEFLIKKYNIDYT